MQQTYQDLEKEVRRSEQIVIKSKCTTHDRSLGKVFTIDISENNLPGDRDTLTKRLMHQEVLLDGIKQKVIGLELFAAGDYFQHTECNILVKELLNPPYSPVFV